MIEKIETVKARVKMIFFMFKLIKKIPKKNNINSPKAVRSPETNIEQEKKIINKSNLFL